MIMVPWPFLVALLILAAIAIYAAYHDAED